MFPQLDLVTSPDVPLKDKVTYYASVNLFHGANIDEKQIKGVKDKINELIASPLSRCDGLLLLEAVLQQRTAFYYEKWQQIIIANLKATNSINQDITLRILKLMLRPSKSAAYIYNIEKQVTPVIDLLAASNNSNCLPAIECLYLCMRHYPQAAFPKLELVESFLIKQMDTNSTQICEATTNCFSVLPQCLLVKDCSKSARAKAFTSAFKKMLYTLQNIFNVLLNTNEVFYIDIEDEPDSYPLPEMPDTNFSEIMMFARIFSSFSICVAKFLCQENAVFEVPVLWIIKFIDKVFNLTDHIKNCKSDERRDLLELSYPTIVKGAFTVLESLVQNFPLIEQTENIISLLRKALDASYVATFIGGPNCQMRNITWRILNIWLKRNGTQISIEAGNTTFFLRELFQDIKPENFDEISPMTIKRQKIPSKNKKTEDVFPETDEYSNFNKSRIGTCNEALKVLNEFVNTASAFQEEKFKEDIANHVFTTCHEIQKNVHPRKKFPFPYMNDKIRKNLYKIVIALGTSSDFNIKVLQQAFAVLRVAQKDKSCKIKLLNRKANNVARHLLQPKKKFPDAVTNKTTIYETPKEEDVCSGWENVAIWNANHSNQENHNADLQIEITDAQTEIVENNASLSPETHNTSVEESEIQNNFPSQGEYTSKFDRSLNTSHSDSENESIMEQDIAEDENNEDSIAKPFITAVHANNIIKNETPTEIDVSSEDENSSIGEEELEDTRVEEEEVEEEEEEEEELNLNKAAVHADQNGLASTSEDEETAANLTKSENGEYSSEDGSCEEEETSKEVCNDLKHEIETLEEDERPTKKQRLNEDLVENLDEERLAKKMPLNDEESVETLNEDNGLTKVQQIIEVSAEVTLNKESENLSEDAKVEDDLNSNSVSEEVIQNSCHLEEESKTNKSPTFDEMCADLVLCESAQLADS